MIKIADHGMSDLDDPLMKAFIGNSLKTTQNRWTQKQYGSRWFKKK